MRISCYSNKLLDMAASCCTKDELWPSGRGVSVCGALTLGGIGL